jgi:hypothetical protein
MLFGFLPWRDISRSLLRLKGRQIETVRSIIPNHCTDTENEQDEKNHQ